MITPISHFQLKYESFHTGFSKLLISFRNAYFKWQILVASTKFEVLGGGGGQPKKKKKRKITFMLSCSLESLSFADCNISVIYKIIYQYFGNITPS